MAVEREELSLTQIHVSCFGSLRVRATLIHCVQQLLLHLSDGVTVQAFDRDLGCVLVLWVDAVQCLCTDQTN